MSGQNEHGPPEPADTGGGPPPPSPRPPDDPSPEEVPLGQRLFDKPFLLLALGVVIMLVFYTGWGLWEVTSLTEAPLP